MVKPGLSGGCVCYSVEIVLDVIDSNAPNLIRELVGCEERNVLACKTCGWDWKSQLQGATLSESNAWMEDDVQVW